MQVKRFDAGLERIGLELGVLLSVFIGPCDLRMRAELIALAYPLINICAIDRMEHFVVVSEDDTLSVRQIDAKIGSATVRVNAEANVRGFVSTLGNSAEMFT